MYVIREVVNCKPLKHQPVRAVLLAAILIGGCDELVDPEAECDALHAAGLAQEGRPKDANPVVQWNRIANLERHPGACSDPTIVIHWSQLAQDNAFAVDPQVTDPFPNARGWTMMYLAMHDALNSIEPRFRQYAFFGTDHAAHPIAARRKLPTTS